jgi:hypothetical protein
MQVTQARICTVNDTENYTFVMNKKKIVTAAVGAVIGWLLKAGGEYRGRHSESRNGLYRLHNELPSIRLEV